MKINNKIIRNRDGSITLESPLGPGGGGCTYDRKSIKEALIEYNKNIKELSQKYYGKYKGL